MADFPTPVPPDEVSRRLADFARTQDPAALWPGLDEAWRIGAARSMEAVVRRVLAGERSVSLDPGAQHAAYALGVAGHTTGMGPLVGRWIEEGLVTTENGPAAFFAEHLMNGRSRAPRIEREVLPAIDALLARNIIPVVLKGFHTARTYFDEPGVRPMADVDLLVHPAEVANAEDALRSVGFRPNSEVLRPYSETGSARVSKTASTRSSDQTRDPNGRSSCTRRSIGSITPGWSRSSTASARLRMHSMWRDVGCSPSRRRCS